MGMIIGIIAFSIAGSTIPMIINRLRTSNDTHDSLWLGRAATATRVLFFGAALIISMYTSLITLEKDELALLECIYCVGELDDGQIIAIGNTKGPKANIIKPGFHFIPGLNIFNRVSIIKNVEIPKGSYATLSAKDGKLLPLGATYAPSFQVQLKRYLNAENFLTSTSDLIGFKGPQATYLPPGTWRINTFLWVVSKPKKLTNVPEGTVAVIKSNVQSSVNYGSQMAVPYPTSCEPIQPKNIDTSALTIPLVPVGCVGIWETPLGQGQYYINSDVHNVTIVPVRVQAWEYEGGFKARSVALSVDAKGEITQAETSEVVPQPKNAAAPAIDIKIDGYTMHQGVRILVQVEAKNAPFIVASVGGLTEIEDRIITPATQSTLRDLAGTVINITEPVFDPKSGKPVIDDETGLVKTRTVRRPIEPMDLIEAREILQSIAEAKIRPEGVKAGVTIKEVRFLKPDLPPEVLIPRKRKQLAFAMARTMIQEQIAQQERIKKDKTAAEADQQPELVKAEINVKRALQYKKERIARGEADRRYLEEVAKGQMAQRDVLGKELVAKLKMLEMILKNPEALKHLPKIVPNTVVIGGNGGVGSLEGFAAILNAGTNKDTVIPVK